VSLNRWAFKWRINVKTLSHSLMTAGKEFQMDVAATKNTSLIMRQQLCEVGAVCCTTVK